MKNWIAGAMGLALVACGSDNENYLESGKQSIELLQHEAFWD